MTARVNDESGASLIMVIVFVMVFSVIMAALLELTGTGLRTTTAYADLGDDQRSFDAAVEGAINAIRSSNTAGLQDAACDDFVYAGISVTCTPVGNAALDGGIDDLMPKYAILTLGTGSCEGLELGGGKEMAVSGGIASNSRIAIDEKINRSCAAVSGNGAMVHVFGDAYARNGWCTADRLTATRERDCNEREPETEAQPPYLPAVPDISGLAVDPAATCATTSGIVAFSPGVYTELPTYHAEREGCTGTVWWFQPGAYYFDFLSTEPEWAINPHNVVGGTPVGWSAASDPSSVPQRGACADPGVTATPSPGVQFILGGTSRISTQGTASATSTGILELCAGADAVGNQRIAVFALDGDEVDTRVTTTGAFATSPTLTNPSSPSGVFVNTGVCVNSPLCGAVTPDDGSTVTGVISSEVVRSGSVVFAGFDDIPDGSIVTGVYADVRHAEGTKLEPVLDLRYVNGSGATVEVDPIDLTQRSAMTTDRTPNLLAKLSGHFVWKDVNSLTATYTVQDVKNPQLTTTHVCKPPTGPNRCSISDVATPETQPAQLDAVTLYVEYTTPGFRPQDSGTEPVLSTTVNPVAIFRGTFFAPDADLNINVHNAGETVFARGVVANAIVGNVSTSSQQEGAPFSLPGLTSRREVLFEAGIDSDGNGDVDAGEVRVRARVAYDDSDSIFGRAVNVLSWVVVR